MIAATAAANKTRKARTAATVRAPANFISSNSNLDSITRLRLQRLSASYGLIGLRADLICALAWGEVKDV